MRPLIRDFLLELLHVLFVSEMHHEMKMRASLFTTKFCRRHIAKGQPGLSKPHQKESQLTTQPSQFLGACPLIEFGHGIQATHYRIRVPLLPRQCVHVVELLLPPFTLEPLLAECQRAHERHACGFPLAYCSLRPFATFSIRAAWAFPAPDLEHFDIEAASVHGNGEFRKGSYLCRNLPVSKMDTDGCPTPSCIVHYAISVCKDSLL